MGILLGLGDVQLRLAVVREILAQRVLHVLLVKEDMDALERSVVGGHAVVLQTGDGVHAFLGHVLLGEHDGQLLGAVVAVVEENHGVAFLDGAVESAVHDGLHELVGHAFVIGFLHCLHHVGSLLSGSADEHVVGFLHTCPTLVAVHGIETSHDGGYASG